MSNGKPCSSNSAHSYPPAGFGYLTHLFWDGRARSLEAQALQPLTNPVEMGMKSHKDVELRVRLNPTYQGQFKKVFPDDSEITIDIIVKAIAAFERTLITPNAPYDNYINGDETALSAQQISGMKSFDKLGCRTCHVDPSFSSAGRIKNFGAFRFFPIFLDNEYVEKYELLIDGNRSSVRVPSLRNVEQTSPYFHNGSVRELKEAVKVMATVQLHKKIKNSNQIQAGPQKYKNLQNASIYKPDDRAVVSEAEIVNIVAFLKSLSSPVVKDVIKE